MKRKKLLKTGLLCAGLLLGAGYAVINSKEVTINGNISSEIRDVNVTVYYDFAEEFDWNRTGNVMTFSPNDYYTAFKTVGETKFISLDIGNGESDFSVVLSIKNYDCSSPCFTISSAKVGETELMIEGSSVSFAPNERKYLLINIEMIEIPITESESDATFSIELEFTPVRGWEYKKI